MKLENANHYKNKEKQFVFYPPTMRGEGPFPC